MKQPTGPTPPATYFLVVVHMQDGSRDLLPYFGDEGDAAREAYEQVSKERGVHSVTFEEVHT